MATFRIGQRVRIVHHLFGHPAMVRFVGVEGVIDSSLQADDRYPDKMIHIVETDCGYSLNCMPEELEPADRNSLTEWDKCAWQPTPEVEHA